MIHYLLSKAEFIALGLNIFMTMAFLLQRDWPKTIYWLGAVLLVLGIITMRSR